MKKTHLTNFPVIFLIFLSFELHAQENEIGVNLGFGKTALGESGMIFVRPFESDLENYYKVGFCYYYTPKNAIITLKTGLDFDYKGINEYNRIHENRLSYLRTPLGIDFIIGEKFQYIIGGGLFASYLLTYTGISGHPYFENTKNRFQIGWYANAGIGYQISEKYNLSLKYQYSADLTNLYDNSQRSPGGSIYEKDAKTYDGFIVLCLKYKLVK